MHGRSSRVGKVEGAESESVDLELPDVRLLDPVRRHVLPLYHVSGTRADAVMCDSRVVVQVIAFC